MNSEDDAIARILNEAKAADAAAKARSERLMPNAAALKTLAKKFPVPLDWWNEE